MSYHTRPPLYVGIWSVSLKLNCHMGVCELWQLGQPILLRSLDWPCSPAAALTPAESWTALQAIANNFAPIAAVVPYFLDAVNLAHRVVGPKPLEWVSGKLNKWSNKYIPEWNPYMPSVRPRLSQAQAIRHNPSAALSCMMP